MTLYRTEHLQRRLLSELLSDAKMVYVKRKYRRRGGSVKMKRSRVLKSDSLVRFVSGLRHLFHCHCAFVL